MNTSELPESIISHWEDRRVAITDGESRLYAIDCIDGVGHIGKIDTTNHLCGLRRNILEDNAFPWPICDVCWREYLTRQLLGL